MIKAHPVAGKRKSIDLCNAFVRGAPKSATGHCFYGVNPSNLAAWRAIKNNIKETWWFIDGSYFDKTRGQQFRITRNRIQVLPADHTSDGKRFAKLGIEVAPMRDPIETGYCLAVEQSPAFMNDVVRNPKWLDDRAALAVKLGTEVRRRPWSADKPGIGNTLQADLHGAQYVLTHSSAAAVEARLAGLPVVVSARSCMSYVEDVDRLHAFQVLADMQFSADEMRSGEAWATLNQKS